MGRMNGVDIDLLKSIPNDEEGGLANRGVRASGGEERVDSNCSLRIVMDNPTVRSYATPGTFEWIVQQRCRSVVSVGDQKRS